MEWNRSRAEARIKEFLERVPQAGVSVESFDTRFAREQQYRMQQGLPGLSYNPLVRIPPSQAILVNGVHIYVQLIDYHSVLTDVDRETESRHKRALKFLHTHYTASDRVVIEYAAQRVDYHGPRLHAVIATPTGPENEVERVRRAVDLAQAMRRMIAVTGEKVLGGEFRTGVRIGIDSGVAVAVNSGRADEQEPLFLGNPANYAAKLADGDVPGIFMSDRVRSILGMSAVGDLTRQKLAAYIPDGLGSVRVNRSMSDERIEALAESLKTAVEPQIRDAEFQFRRHEPPLSTIDYAQLMPSNTVHMPMMSIFADIDGFTKYVQVCIDQGRVKELVSNLHVLRKELAAVLKTEFKGRKIRFIGDCLHGVLAEGTRSDIDAAATIETAVLCAGGMRSSFQLAQGILPGIQNMGLAIGLEYGNTPITRLGTRGEMSVRCATSRAVSESEFVQSTLDGYETGLGTRAMAKAPARVRRLFDQNAVATGLSYSAAAALLLPVPAQAAISSSSTPFRPHAKV